VLLKELFFCGTQEKGEKIVNKIYVIINQIQQYLRKRRYFGHYIHNIARVLFNIPIIDYRKISHGNKLVHLSDYHKIFPMDKPLFFWFCQR